MLELYPAAGEENKYATDTRAVIADAINKANKQQSGGGKTGGNSSGSSPTPGNLKN
jgi:hypothetical protein